MYDLIIIGGGPAGISAGIYASRQGLDVLLISKDFGGQMARKAVPIENYPGFESIQSLELIKLFEKHLRKQKIEIERDAVGKIKKTKNVFFVFTSSKNKFEAKAVIIATGADPRPLEVPGEKEFIGKGVSYCTLCDGPLFSNKDVAVIGGGNSGVESALFMKNIARKIYLLEYLPKLSADEANQKQLEKVKNVKIITSASLKNIEGKDFVESLTYEDRNSGKEKKIKVEAVFIEVGLQPATSFVKGLVEFNQRDEIKINSKTCQTSVPGLFAAGDVTDGRIKQIVVAAGEGAKAALSVFQYLQSLE